MNRSCLFAPVVLFLLTWAVPAAGGLITISVEGTVASNGLSSGPLAGVQPGSDAVVEFCIDLETVTVLVPGQLWEYQVINESFLFTADGGSMEDITGEHSILSMNNYGYDGIWWEPGDDIGWGYIYSMKFQDYGSTIFPSPDLAECTGSWGASSFDYAQWDFNEELMLTLGTLTVSPPMAVSRLSWAGVKASFP
ncbi:MAG TPA: hypothetical protein PLM22_02660 [Candidatus Sabulitectum sp.]|nr:hypothetical protein [Candidatus Sabulitectum sp.]HPJ27807.1 hypothetical protein [Candidatus Sabulitectum sp.]HPR23404.1 hypothetical protein [Candidatus Sabulitectum sp.]